MSPVADELYNLIGKPESVTDFLDSLSFDELVEIDIPNNRVRNIYHIDGKFFVPIFDGSYKDLFNYSVDHMVHPDDRHLYIDFMHHRTLLERLAKSDTPGVLSAEFRYRLQSGDWLWVKQVVVGGSHHGLQDGIVRFYVFDIQHRKERELGIATSSDKRPVSLFDDLTGLLREKEFFTKARSFLETHDCAGWCLIAMDIDQFKLFNDWYGREAGDYALAKIGSFFKRRESSHGWLAGYLGQDDFCVLMPYDVGQVDELFDDICDILSENGTSMSFKPIFGICMVEESSAVLDLLDCAKLASQAAKGDFKHSIRMFEPTMYKETEAEYRLLSEFQHAIAGDDIFYHVQPQCRLSSGNIVGVEALARWRKPDGSIMPPDQFIPVLEKYGFITDLDRYIWEDVCKNLKAWRDKGLDAVPISVNVSKNDIYTLDVADHFVRLVETYDLPPSLLKIEITESAYVDDTDKVRDTVTRLRDRGFTVLMDDFGSGYSSLNMLDSLNVDIIKLDMRFLQMNEADKRKSIHIVESVVNMAKTMDMAVITEGVETAEQADFLRSIGCRYVQGFYCYRPMSSEEFEKLIGDGRIIDRQGFATKPNDEFRLREFLDRNVYSDSMLNSILGAVAVFSWDGEDVNVSRFNEQFYETVNIPEFEGHTQAIQEIIDPKDRSKLYGLLERSMDDQLNGSFGVLRFRKPDSSPADFLNHFYYLGEENGARRFYCSVRNVTKMNELRDEMKLLSKVTDKSVVFLKKHRGSWSYKVEIHGLEDDLGLTMSAFERELKNGRFFERIVGAERGMLKNLVLDSGEIDEHFSITFGMKNARDEHITLSVRYFCVEDDGSSFSYILMFQKA